MVIFADDRTHRWNVGDLRSTGSAAGEDVPVLVHYRHRDGAGVVVKTGERWPAFLTLPMPPIGGTVMGAALTLEPMGSSAAAEPEGKELAHLML